MRLHGLLRPESVMFNGRALQERRPEACGEGCEGWTWNKERRTATIRELFPAPVNERVTFTVHGAGTFADAEMLQRVLEYRRRLRLTRDDEQLKWGMLLHGMDIKKPPRVIRETEKVEGELNRLVASPQRMAQHPPDFAGMTQQVLRAFVDHSPSNQPGPFPRPTRWFGRRCKRLLAVHSNPMRSAK